MNKDEQQDRVRFLEDMFDRHAAREKHMAEIVFQHIKHGDEAHQKWLRKELVKVLCKDKTKAVQTFDELAQALQIAIDALDEMGRELNHFSQSPLEIDARNKIEKAIGRVQKKAWGAPC